MRLWRLCVVSAVVATWAGCGGEDDPVPPPAPNGGSSTDAGIDGGPQGGTGNDVDGSPGGAGGNAGMGGSPDDGGSGGEAGNGGDAGNSGNGGGGTGGDGGDGGLPDVPDGAAGTSGDEDAGLDGGFDAEVPEAGPPPFDPGPPGTYIEFSMPAIEGGAPSSNGEMRIAAGADDKLYVTDTGLNALFRVDVEGNFEEFALSPSSQPRGITLGPDGNVWFVLHGSDKVARITPAGTITEFSIPNPPVGGSGPHGITLGQDGNLWFTEQKGDRVGRIIISPGDGSAGDDVVFTITSLPGAGRFAKDITRGPEGDVSIWFTEQFGRVAKIGTTSLFVEEFGDGLLSSPPLGIAAGPDGNMWFTEVGDLIGQSNVNGNAFDEFDVDSPGCLPLSIIVGSDDKLWYTCYGIGMLGRTDPADPDNPESFTLFVDSEPTGLVNGPGEAIWFVNEGLRSVGYMVPPL